MKSGAFDKKSITFYTKSNGNHRTEHRQEVKANTLKPIAFDTNSNGNYYYRKSIRDREEINRKPIAFDKNATAFHTKSNGNHRNSIRNQ